jgi:galactokinase
VRQSPAAGPLEALVARFRAQYGRAPAVAVRAPGRVNLIGEHTDYNEGLVLPCAIDRDTVALAAPRGDGVFACVSREEPEPLRFTADAPPRAGWGTYAGGVVQALARRGLALPGADLALASELPAGAGLSSSAALCVALVAALDAAFELGLDADARAETAHRAESEFAGVPCGRMDSLACVQGRRDCALRIDCRSLAVRPVPLPARLRILVADSGVRRRLAAGAYGDRRAECQRALALAREAGIAPPDARALRDLDPAALPALERALPDLPFRRARHVLRENERVEATSAALAAGDLARAGALLREGMASLQHDFEVSLPELDALCAIADALPGVHGSRLCGAGFGGCSIHLVEANAAPRVVAALADGFAARFGRRPPVLAVRAADGASRLALQASAETQGAPPRGGAGRHTIG